MEDKAVPPHIQRILTERTDLVEKLTKLDAFISSEHFNSTVPNTLDRELMHAQSKVMHEYNNILTERLSRADSNF